MKPGQRKHSMGTQGARGPYWKRAHHDWRFWVGAILMLVAMAVYVLSDSLALRPRSDPGTPLPSVTGPGK